MPASHWGRYPLPVEGIRPRPCAACAGRQAVELRCHSAPSTVSADRAHLRVNRFLSPDIQRRTANEDRVLSRAEHQNRHPHSAILVWPCSVSVQGKHITTQFCVFRSSWLDTENCIRSRNSCYCDCNAITNRSFRKCDLTCSA